jgi:hypothetical protein
MAFVRNTAAPTGTNAAARAVSYIFSTGAVARDNHTIDPNGWQLGAFRQNPVFLFCHDSSAPPIGRVSDIGVSAGALRGTVVYADAQTYDFADTIYRLVVGGFLNSVSVSWDPIKFSYSTDRSRPGGIDFKEQELREISQVPVPADVNAIATARSRGINTGPLYTWAGRMLDLGARAPLPRGQLEALRRCSETAAQASRTVTIYDLMKHDTPADRKKVARFAAYENARQFGVEIPGHFWPPQDRVERESVAQGLRFRFGA